MKLINDFRNFVLNSQFACSGSFDVEGLKWIPQAPKYSFNCAEKIGNKLIYPLYFALSKLKETKSLWIKTGLAVVGIVATPFALIGSLFKILGEKLNPVNAKLRLEALRIYRHLQDIYTIYHEDLKPLFDKNGSFDEYLLKELDDARVTEYAKECRKEGKTDSPFLSMASDVMKKIARQYNQTVQQLI